MITAINMENSTENNELFLNRIIIYLMESLLWPK